MKIKSLKQMNNFPWNIAMCLIYTLITNFITVSSPNFRKEFRNNLYSQSSNLRKSYEIQKFDSSKVVIDCDYSLKEALGNKKIPKYIKQQLKMVTVVYYSFDHKLHKGQIVINDHLAKEIKEIFYVLRENKFLIDKVIPIVKYNWSDSASMEDDNTSAFNYRFVKGTRILSPHAKGRAIDINPKLNPQIKDGKIRPSGAKYNPGIPGTITKKNIAYKIFRFYGWQWGGTWKHLKDYQHFQK